MQVLYLERFHCAHSNTCKLELWRMFLSLHAYPPCGVKQVSMLVHCVHVYIYIHCTYSLTFPILRDNSYYGVLIWECLISMRSETIAYFVSTVTVIYMLVFDFQCKYMYMYMYMYIHHDVGECYSEASLEPLPHSLQSGSWTDRGDHVWRECRATDWIRRDTT